MERKQGKRGKLDVFESTAARRVDSLPSCVSVNQKRVTKEYSEFINSRCVKF